MSIFNSSTKGGNVVVKIVSFRIFRIFRIFGIQLWFWALTYDAMPLFNDWGVVRTQEKALDKSKKAIFRILKFEKGIGRRDA